MAGQMTISFTKEMNEPLVVDELKTLFQQGDKNAAILRIDMMNGIEKADLTGLAATGQFERGDGSRVPLSGNVNGNVITVTIPEACYNVSGGFFAFVRLTSDNSYVRRTVLRIMGRIASQSDGPLVDTSNVIPSVDDVIAKFKEMEDAVEDCNNATTRANSAAASAETAAAGAGGWANATASATQIAAGSTPTVSVSTLGNGNKKLTFGIPAGVTPSITFEVETGEPGTDVEVKQSGTPAAPVVKLIIPRGDTGAVDGVDYYTGNPAALGTASPGSSNGVARGNHVHPMPTGEQIPKSGTDKEPLTSAIESVAASNKDGINRIVALESKFQTGTLSVPAEAGVVATQEITFPTAFASTPAVMVVLNSNASAVLDGGNCSPSGISTTGFTVNVFRTTAGNVPVRWMAFKP